MVFVSFHSQKLWLAPRTLKVILVLVYKLDLVTLLEDFESCKVYYNLFWRVWKLGSFGVDYIHGDRSILVHMCGYLCVSFNLSKNLCNCFLEMVTRFNILVIIAFPKFSDSGVISPFVFDLEKHLFPQFR